MAEKKLYVGSVGPYLYDDTELISDPDGDWAGLTQRAFITDGNIYITGDVRVGSLSLDDTDDSHYLTVKWNENDTVNRTLDLLVVGGNRSLTINEDFTIGDGYTVTIQAIGQANQFTMNEAFTIGDGFAGTLTYSAASKTLTVEDTSIVSQDYTADANVIFNQVTCQSTIFPNIHLNTKEPTGFLNRTDSTLSFVDLTRIFTIAPAVTSYQYYQKGVLNTISVNKTVTLDDTTQLNMIYFNSAGVLTAGTSFTWDPENVLVAVIYYDADNNRGLVQDERHGAVMDWATHRTIHDILGAGYEEGFALSFLNATFTVGAGEFHDEDITFDVAQQSTCYVLYRKAAADSWGWISPAGTKYYYEDGSSNTTYDDGSGTPAAVNANQYSCMWIFVTNDKDTPIYAIMGQRQDTTIANARANNTFNGLDLEGLPGAEMLLLARIIIKNDATPYEETEDYRGSFITGRTSTAYGAANVASAITTDTTNFNNLLSVTDTTVQLALDTIDNALGTGSSPVFVTVKLSGLTDGYVPYHVSDAVGLANSPIFISGTDIGVSDKIYFIADTDTYLTRSGTDRFAFYGGGTHAMTVWGGTTGLVSVAIGANAVVSDDLLVLNYSPTNDNAADGLVIDLSSTATAGGSYANRAININMDVDVAVGITNTGSPGGIFLNMLADAGLAGTVGAGAGTGLYYGQRVHIGTATGATGTINTDVYGYYFRGFYQAGTISGNIYGFFADVLATGGTLSGTYYPLYLLGTGNYSYIAGLVGIRTVTPVAPLEVEDAATTASMLVKITQDNEDVYGLAIGNDTYSTTDTNGLKFKVKNAGAVEVSWTAGDFTLGPDADLDALKLDSNKDLYITAGSLLLSAGSEYINFSATQGATGFGLRDNAGYIQVKHSDYEDTWEDIERTHEISKAVVLVDDFFGAALVAGAFQLGWSCVYSGTGATVGTNSYTDGVHMGAAMLQTGTTTTGYAGIGLWDLIGSPIPGGDLKVEFVVKSTADNSNVLEAYKVLVGLADVPDGTAPANGIYFTYAYNESGGSWECITCHDSTETTTDSAIDVVASTWYRLGFVMSADGATVKFYIDGILKATHTTNIPGTSDSCGPVVSILKSAGTTNRILNVDAFYLRKRVVR